MNMWRSRWLAPALAALALAAVAFITPQHVPLYDGVGFPDEAYRYVKPSSSAQRTAYPPTTAESVVGAAGGKNTNDLIMVSDEEGPQVKIYVRPGVFLGSIQATRFFAKAQPFAPDNPTPQGPVAGNLYRFSATGDIELATFNNSQNASGYIELRLPQGISPGAVMMYRPKPNDAWRALSQTARVGSDIYEAPLTGLGDYALVHIDKKRQQATAAKSRSILIALASLMMALLLIVLAVVRAKSKRQSARGHP